MIDAFNVLIAFSYILMEFATERVLKLAEKMFILHAIFVQPTIFTKKVPDAFKKLVAVKDNKKISV